MDVIAWAREWEIRLIGSRGSSFLNWQRPLSLEYINSLSPPFISLSWPSLYSICPIMSVSGTDPVNDAVDSIALAVSTKLHTAADHEQPADVSFTADKSSSESTLNNPILLPKEDASNRDLSANADSSVSGVCFFSSHHSMPLILLCHQALGRATRRCKWLCFHSRRCATGHHSTRQRKWWRDQSCIGQC